LITPGWPVNAGSEDTNPLTLTTRVTRSKSPITLFTAARAFIAQTAASSLAVSAETSAPTFPVTVSFPATVGSWPEVYTWLPLITAGT